MDGWPQVLEPLLRERQGMSTEEFLKLLTELLEAMPARELDDERYERAIGYPWERRPGSCLVTDKGVEDLEDIDPKRRNELVHEYVQESPDRVPLLTYGANSSPERLALKLATFRKRSRGSDPLWGPRGLRRGGGCAATRLQFDAGDADSKPGHQR